MGDSEQAVIQATKALKFLDIDGELLPPNIDIPFGRIDEYADRCKTVYVRIATNPSNYQP
jgi:hypothetical protein